MEWFGRSMRLNPLNGYNWLGYGQCVDWLGTQPGVKPEDAEPYFRRAIELDPDGEYTSAIVGWHYVNLGDDAAARTWFERSRLLEWEVNMVAKSYLPIVEARMLKVAG